MTHPRCIASPWAIAAAAIVVTILATPALGFPGQDDQSPGSLALGFRKRSNIWSRVDAGFVDASVTSTPPDSTKLDRRLEALAVFGFDAAITPRWGVRLNLKADISKRRQAEQAGPQANVDSQMNTYAPAADVTFVTDKGLELFAGLHLQHSAAYTETVTAAGSRSETKFDAVSVLARRFGVVRRAGVWSGGFYYVQGGEAERKFSKSASDGSAFEGREYAFVPSRASVFGEIAVAPWTYDFELAFIQARGMGPRTEDNATVYTDHFEARLGALTSVTSGFGLKGSVFHRTLAYASNAYVSLETMPVTSAKILGVFGDAFSNLNAGLIYTFGQDGQSLPEFNARYQMRAIALTMGMILPL